MVEQQTRGGIALSVLQAQIRGLHENWGIPCGGEICREWAYRNSTHARSCRFRHARGSQQLACTITARVALQGPPLAI